MFEKIFELIMQYDLDTVFIALLINLLTAIVKLPLKAFAKKLKDGTKLTRFIVFMPIILGFGVVYLYVWLLNGSVAFGKEFYTLWLTASSLCLTFYAILEKMFPSKKTVMTAEEIEQNKALIENIQEKVDADEEISIEGVLEEAEKISKGKIVLKGGARVKLE